MAEHMVPQNVEADDKLIGPFSFRQFVYLMIAAAAGLVAFFLGRIAIPLALIPAPIFAFFLVIALPLRKDQPTEIYLAAVIKYLFRPRVRIWKADGEQPLVEISAPIVDDTPKTKDLAGDEVSRRLSFLANLSDTQGWSTRGLNSPVNNTNLTDEFAADAINTQDVMDNSAVSNSIDTLLDKSDQQMRANAINMMNQAVARQQAANVVPMPTIMPQQQPAPNLANPTNLPTYNYGNYGNYNQQPMTQLPTYQQNNPQYPIQPTRQPQVYQTTALQPRHNQQLQALPKANPTVSTAAVPQPPQQPVTPTVPVMPTISTDNKPVMTKEEEKPTKSVKTEKTTVSSESSSKPVIIDKSDSIIDIKLH
ncbi:MAG: PrgI family protein [Candidatus Saccharibacteria bacterium]|nr:PrgI family protein [Candidatus Saccharibacteria bacterium]